MGNISSKKNNIFSKNLLKNIEYDIERKSNIFPNTFPIFRNTLNETEFYEKLEYVSHFAELYFEQ